MNHLKNVPAASTDVAVIVSPFNPFKSSALNFSSEERAVDDIRQKWQLLDVGKKVNLSFAYELGQMLNGAKTRYGQHGKWKAWIKKNFPGRRYGEANNYRLIASNWELVKECRSIRQALETISAVAGAEPSKPSKPKTKYIRIPNTPELDQVIGTLAKEYSTDEVGVLLVCLKKSYEALLQRNVEAMHIRAERDRRTSPQATLLAV